MNQPDSMQCTVDHGLIGELRKEAILLKKMIHSEIVQCTDVMLFVYFSIIDL